MADYDDIDLMRSFDGEMEEADVSQDANAQAKLQALAQVGDVVRTHLELSADDADARLSLLWNNIERRIEQDDAAAEHAVDRPPTSVREPSGGVWHSIRNWFQGTRGHMTTGVFAAAAAAALVLLLRPPVERQVVVERTVPAVAPAPAVMPVVLKSTPTELGTLDVTDGTSTVMRVGGDEERSAATVIWVTRGDDTSPGDAI